YPRPRGKSRNRGPPGGYNHPVSGSHAPGSADGSTDPVSHPRMRIDPELAAAVLSLLRGRIPSDVTVDRVADDVLRVLECGGYLRGLWAAGGRSSALPPGWGAALERAHRKTRIDTLAALGDFRRIGAILAAEDCPFILLKGSAYLFDLYPDAGQRPLSDIDLLVKPDKARPLHRVLER